MKYFYLYFLFFLFGNVAVFAQSRGAFVEEIANKHSGFTVRVDVNHPNRVYAKDELLVATVESSENGYLYLFYRDAVGNVTMLFPNRFQKRNMVKTNEPVIIPAPGSIFQIRIDAPFGNELFKAVVSKKPLEFFADMDLTGINMLPIAEDDGRELAKSVLAMEQSNWAEHHVGIRTVIAVESAQSVKRMPKRPFLGRFIFRR